MVRSAAVFVGGAVGSLARWAVELALPATPGGFPVGTLAVNVSGAFGLGLAAELLTERLAPRPALRSLIGSGFFGAYTTFSTMALEGVRLLKSGEIATAIFYWAATLILGQMAGVYGMWVGRIELPVRRQA
jgi:CrcB protein